MKKKLNCILLIDDDEPTNFISNMLLEEANCTHLVQIEESGKRALNYLSKAADCSRENAAMAYPELIFLDINMPAMNGWEFLDKYKELKAGQHPETVIILLTTSINPDDSIRADSIPMVSGFENKPLTGNMIQTLLKKHFGDDED
ncbi:MAG: response regulator [Ferruginibacter sp.]